MKKIYMLILLLVILMPTKTFAANLAVKNIVTTPLTFQPAPTSYDASLIVQGSAVAKVGDEFDVPINLMTKGPQICSVKANLSFPADKLQVVSLASGPVFTSEIIKKYDNINGTISYTSGVMGCSKLNSTLYTIKFKAKAAGSAPIKFTNTNVVTVDQTGMPYSVASRNISSTYWIMNSLFGTPKIISRYNLNKL